jgi:hypothetical protein
MHNKYNIYIYVICVYIIYIYIIVINLEHSFIGDDSTFPHYSG